MSSYAGDWRVIFALLACTAASLGQTAGSLLTPGVPVEARLTPGSTCRFSLVAGADQFFKIRVEETEAEVMLRVSGPSGEKIAVAEDRGADLRPLQIVRITKTAGEYLVEVSARRPQSLGGGYRIALDLRPPADEDERRVKAQALFDDAGQMRSHHSAAALKESLVPLESARSVWHQLGDMEREAEVLRDLSETNAEMGNWKAMFEYAELELELRRELHDVNGQANALNNAGWARFSVGEVRDGLRFLNEARDLWHGLTGQGGDRGRLNRRGEAIALSNIAHAYSRSGDNYRALQICERLQPIRKEIGDKRGEAAAEDCIAMSFDSLGESDKVIPHLNRAAALFHDAGDRRGEAAVLSNLGIRFHQIGQYKRSIEMAERSLEIDRTIGERHLESLSMTQLADAYLDSGDQKKAFELAAKAVSSAGAIADRESEARALRVLSSVHRRLHQYGSAAEYATRAVEISRGISNPIQEYLALGTLAGIDRDRGDLPAAHRTLSDALDRVETVRNGIGEPKLRASYFAEVRKLYDQDIEVLMAMHGAQPAENFAALAFGQSERARARTLIEWLSTRSSDALPDSPRPDLKNIQTLLDPQSLLLEYSVGETGSFGWAVTSRSITSFPLPKASELAAAVHAVHAGLSSRIPNPEQSGLEDLSAVLLKPVANQLQKRRLIIVADGALQFLPFSVLSVHGRPLLMDHEIVALPSATALFSLRAAAAQRKPARKLVAVIADPVFEAADRRVGEASPSALSRGIEDASDGVEVERSATDAGIGRLERLPGTRREGEGILALAGKNATLRAFGFDATRELVMSPALAEYRIIHLATHGLLNSRDPDLTGLVLSRVDAQGKARNGFVKAAEVQQLKLSADLVVLSACQTALGKEVRGEGLVGLARAFMAAGSQRVVGTFWQVPDAATAELMGVFYRGILVDHLKPATALRQAQLTVRAQPRWSSPYYWAGFTLLGEWQ